MWGRPISLADVQPGDIVQFRDYRYERTVVTTTPTLTTTEEETHTRPHHTAIVERVTGSQLTVLEQNVPAGAPVARAVLFFANDETRSGNRTVTVRVYGTFWFYRPQQ